MFKKILALLLALLLVFSFAACKKDNADGTSSVVTDDNPTQDYDNGEWDEGEDLTSSEREELEDLWNDITTNGSTEVTTGESSNTSSTGSDDTSSTGTSSSDTSSNDASSDVSSSATSSTSSELSGEVVQGNSPGIY
ncbi:MAG: hypothetical protein IIX54_06230 [Clostridia bacterium]|nr:hypothetical protein [Clostridia bacterium]